MGHSCAPGLQAGDFAISINPINEAFSPSIRKDLFAFKFCLPATENDFRLTWVRKNESRWLYLKGSLERFRLSTLCSSHNPRCNYASQGFFPGPRLGTSRVWNYLSWLYPLFDFGEAWKAVDNKLLVHCVFVWGFC